MGSKRESGVETREVHKNGLEKGRGSWDGRGACNEWRNSSQALKMEEVHGDNGRKR